MDREPGLYWIENIDEPEPAHWNGEMWTLLGTDEKLEENEVVVLSEQPILFGDAPA